MKKISISILVLLFCFKAIGQQFIPLNKTATKKEAVTKIVKVTTVKALNKGKDKTPLKITDKDGNEVDSVVITTETKKTISTKGKVFGVFGAGNLNKEQLEKFNASGKFSCFIKPIIREKSELSFYLSFNKNATNTDSLLASTLIFPEVGNNSFLGTAEYAYCFSQDTAGNIIKEHYVVPFFEFSNKSIRASQDTGNAKLASYHFSTLNYTIGCKYLFRYNKTVDSTNHNVYFSMAGYLSYLNIPNQDTADYRVLLKSNTISDNLWALGIKVGVQFNNFSIFADFRHVLGSDKKIPVRELRGFNSNIGVVFNADIFGF